MTDAPRLPFPVHGTRMDPEAPDEAVGDAARLLFFTNLLAESAGVPVFGLRRQTPYGEATASVHGLLAFKGASAEPEDEELEDEPVPALVRLVWLPEGFVITPRTAEAPQGYGMPPTPNGRGTAGGPVREVIINRFYDNQYPDALYRRVHGAPEAGTRVCAANLFFMDWEMEKGKFGIGMPLPQEGRMVWRAQFAGRFDVNFQEPPSAAWHCHRPQFAHERAEDLYLREQTNLLRAAADMEPLFPVLRGREGELSESPIYMARWSGVIGHDSYRFRDGHISFEFRHQRRSAHGNAAGENLHLASMETGKAFTDHAMASWRNSPGHYANIINDWRGLLHGDPYLYASLDSATRHLAGAAVHTEQLPPYGLDAPTAPLQPPVRGSMAVQIFGADWNFVHFGRCGRERKGVRVRLGLESHVSHCATFFSPFDFSTSASDMFRLPVYVACKGRDITVQTDIDGPIVTVLAAHHVVDAEGKDWLRIFTLERAVNAASLPPAHIVVREGLLHDYENTQRVVDSFRFPDDTSETSTVKVSLSGAKAVFCYTVPVPNLQRFRGSKWDESEIVTDVLDFDDPYATYKRFVWGHELHFIEWRGGAGFAELFTESLDIVPSNSGQDSLLATVACRGSYRLFADYDGEELVYARVHVDSEFALQMATGSKPSGHRTLNSRLVFPDGTEFVFNAGQMGWSVGESGTFAQILWLDILRPQDMVYLRHEWRCEETTITDIYGTRKGLRPASRCSVVARGKVLRVKEDVIEESGHDRGLDVLANAGMPDVRLVAGLGTYRRLSSTAFSFVPLIGAISGGGASGVERLSPARPYKAALVKGGIGFDYMRRGYGEPGHFYDLVGPEIFAPLRASDDVCQVEFYGGEVIAAGRIGSPLRLDGRGWTGDEAYFLEASLDLKAITGLPDLKDNIFPMGVA